MCVGVVDVVCMCVYVHLHVFYIMCITDCVYIPSAFSHPFCVIRKEGGCHWHNELPVQTNLTSL